MAATRDGLEFALGKTGWLAGEFHHIRPGEGIDEFTFGDPSSAPCAVVTITDGIRYTAQFRESLKAEWVREDFALADQVITQLDKWRSALPLDERVLLRPERR